ncbi:MAG: phytanoyl-CoA dioxygenase family protein [Symploca sp. SIO2G7]|nr:phytanoyl-CoA dioxygenase family protein [Symploca sp. SIO2G7]
MSNKLFSESQIETFKKQGFIVVKGMYDPTEMKHIKNWVDEVQSLPEVPGKYMMYFEDSLLNSDQRVLARVENFCNYHEGFNSMINQEKMQQSVSELLGETAVLFKEKINFKMPGGKGFTPHQDAQAGWDDYASFFITALVSVDESTVENGCLEMAPGFNQGLIGELWKQLSEENMKGMEFSAVPTKPGDAVFFDSYAPHRSGPNLTKSPRRVLYLTYNRASEGDHRVQYYVDKRKNYPPDIEREAGKKYEFKV